MEYLFTKRFTLGDVGCKQIEWTDYMKRFLVEMIQHQYETSNKVDFSIDGADLTNVADVQPRYRSRSKPLDAFATDGKNVTRPVMEKLVKHSPSMHLYSLHDRHGQFLRDFANGLMWRREGFKQLLTFSEANEYIEELNSIRCGGYANWRLPTLEEGLLIYDFRLQLATNKDGFTGTVSLNPLFSPMYEHIWTSDEHSDGAAVVRLRGAKTFDKWKKIAFEGIKHKRDRFRVLAVRST